VVPPCASRCRDMQPRRCAPRATSAMSVLATHLSALAGAGWGLVGGLCVEALWLHSQIRSAKKWSWRRPIPQGLDAYLISVVLRVGAGAGLAAAAVSSGQASGALAAFGLGVGAPLAVQKLAKSVRLTGALTTEADPAAAPGPPAAPGEEVGDAG
jgi:hypothetical protein